ncbi:MAG: non-hydrolyzing UDP-N-acetylglucosamine 2-epimerase [Planctomycetota bacterium]|jgi:UDP-N-acetylglucosamine 2-epimerase (non-hydrolysing)
MLNILCVCGARPNFMKIAPVMDALGRRADVRTFLVHTGQHYDERMSRMFFDDLGIPRPNLNLEVGSASHAVQTAEVMKRFEPVCLEQRPDWVVVVGDVNSTIACALVAAKIEIKVAHVEAGLRSFDRTMPEEINRILTDAISDMLFVTEPSGVENLRREGIADTKVHFVGNVMIDALLRSRARADESEILSTLGLTEKGYAAVTLHRPSNVDDAGAFSSILTAFETIASDMPVIFPIHPRSRGNLDSLGLAARARRIANLHLLEPLGYFDFVKLMSNAAVMLTDSGGIQEETTILGVPCLTLRDNTERPITLAQGTNRLTGNRTDAIVAAYHDVRDNPPRTEKRPDLWDGGAAERIVECLLGAD